MDQNTQPISQTPPPPKKQSGVLTGILLFLLGILVGLAIDKSTVLSSIRIPYLSATPTLGPTASWKTYTNETHSFSFKYPDTLTLSNFYDQNTGSPVKSVLFGFEFKNSKSQTVATFTIYDSGTATVESWIKTNKNIVIPDDISNTTRQQIGVLDITTIPYENGTFYIFSDNKNKIFSFGTNSDDSFTDQILSTFKFLDQTTTSYACPPGGWVDCMPGPDAKPECSADAMAWYKANCPDFKGGAL